MMVVQEEESVLEVWGLDGEALGAMAGPALLHWDGAGGGDTTGDMNINTGMGLGLERGRPATPGDDSPSPSPSPGLGLDVGGGEGVPAASPMASAETPAPLAIVGPGPETPARDAIVPALPPPPEVRSQTGTLGGRARLPDLG
jgi:hypothetical protein